MFVKRKHDREGLGVGFFRISCEAGLGDCTAEARPSTGSGRGEPVEPRRARRKSNKNSILKNPLRTPCLCGEYFFIGIPEEPELEDNSTLAPSYLFSQRLKRRCDRSEIFFRYSNRLGLFQTMAGEIADDEIIGTEHSRGSESFGRGY